LRLVKPRPAYWIGRHPRLSLQTDRPHLFPLGGRGLFQHLSPAAEGIFARLGARNARAGAALRGLRDKSRLQPFKISIFRQTQSSASPPPIFFFSPPRGKPVYN
jgi:hypothetical protein